ncbi:MAG: hypothetical protein KBS99_01290 [Prevotellaceae bacterium]|nr:hypothetical protein [Candidatus Colivivens caballi]
MKKILFSIATLAVAFGFTACSNEDEALSVKGEKTTVLAMTEASTRTALESDGENAYNVVWSEGDEITINGQTFTLNSGAGKTAATFEGTAPTNDNLYTAFYGTNGSDFGPTQYYEAGKTSNFPMYADADVKDGKIAPLQFKNICGILRLTVKGTATITSIKITANEKVSGDLVFGYRTGEYGLYQGDPYLVIDCGAGIALTEGGTAFNIAMMPGTYTGVKITLTNTEHKSCTKTFKGTNGLVIERSKITKAAFTATTFNEGTTGTAKAIIGGVETDVNWVQLWENGPKFAEYNVAYKMNYYDATKTGSEFVWGSNWRLPRQDEYYELWIASANYATPESRAQSKVTCEYDADNKCYIFTGKEEGYTENKIILPGENNYEYYWSNDPTDNRYAWYFCLHMEYRNGALDLGCSRNAFGTSTSEMKARNNEYYVRPILNETK